jgi:hypothetical protein
LKMLLSCFPRRSASAFCLAAFGALALGASGCRSRDATAMKYVALVSDTRPGKSLGLINALDCATQVFGIGRNPASLSVNGALERAQREQGVRYLNNMSIDQEHTNIFMYNRICIVVKGEAFK